MIHLLERADPAVGHEANKARLRAKVDEKIGISAPLRPIRARTGRPWLVAVVGFAVGILLISVPALLRPETPSLLAPPVGDLGNLPGVEQVVPLASGGVQTAAVDGDTIWVVTALARELQMVSASSGRIQATYSIVGYVEGVVVGGGYVWLLSYDNGGEVLRFDPADGSVDLTIPIGGEPWYGADWFADRLWVSNHKSELIQISPEGEILANDSGELKGEGLGYHWLNDPETGLISSLANDGTRGEMVIPTDGTINPVGSGIRSVTETGGYLWLMHGDYPYASAISRFDPTTGTLEPIPITVGLLGMTDFDGSLWVTSSTDDLLVRVDPESGEISRNPMPGKPGGLFEAGGSLWVMLHQPGALIRLDTEADLIETGETALETGTNGHRLLCTGNRDSGGPTVLLEPSEWIDYGSWSVIQAELSGEGHLVCANGYLEEGASPERRAADLASALEEARITGPYVLVANSDGVHATRLFAEGRDDVAGVVLVAPMPVSFPGFYNELLGPELLGPNGGHPDWSDLDPAVSDGLSDFGDAPLVVIDQDELFLSPRFVTFVGRDKANELNDFWRQGVDFYAGLSSDSSRLVASETGFNQVLWDQPYLVVTQVLDILGRVTE